MRYPWTPSFWAFYTCKTNSSPFSVLYLRHLCATKWSHAISLLESAFIGTEILRFRNLKTFTRWTSHWVLGVLRGPWGSWGSHLPAALAFRSGTFGWSPTNPDPHKVQTPSRDSPGKSRASPIMSGTAILSCLSFAKQEPWVFLKGCDPSLHPFSPWELCPTAELLVCFLSSSLCKGLQHFIHHYHYSRTRISKKDNKRNKTIPLWPSRWFVDFPSRNPSCAPLRHNTLKASPCAATWWRIPYAHYAPQWLEMTRNAKCI